MAGSLGKSQRALALLVVLVLSSIVVGISIRIPIVMALDCGNLGGSVVSGECQVSTNQSSKAGTYTIAYTLRIMSGVSIDATGPGSGGISLSITGDFIMETNSKIEANDDGLSSGSSARPIVIVVSGNMEMKCGSSIRAENNINGGNGARISITVGGSMTLRGPCDSTPGAVISSRKTAGAGDTGVAGNIAVAVGDCAAVPQPTGVILMEPGSTVTATSTGPAGAIVMNSCRHIAMDGLVESSSGLSGTGAKQGPGGGTITLDAGCDLVVSDDGKVSSHGQDPGADLVHLEGGCSVLIFGIVESTGAGHAIPNNPPNHCNGANRPDKASRSTTCVEVWAGDSLTVDGTGEHNGQVSADSGSPGGNEGIGWIDLFSRGNITITGSTTKYAVHAHGYGGSGGNGEEGGLITVKSTEGNVTASGLALEAGAPAASNSDGGTVTVEAALDVDLDAARVDTQGHGIAGTISVRSFNGFVLGSAPGVLDTTGDASTTNGGITLQGCGTSAPGDGVAYTGTTDANVVTVADDACGGAPTLPTYVTLPDCLCRELVPPPCKWCTKGAVLSQVTQNIGHCCAVPDILVDLRLPKDDPIEQDELGSNIPATGSLQAAIDYVNRPDWLSLDPTPGNETFIGVTAKDCGTGIAGSPPACAGLTGRGPYGHSYENVVITNPWEDVRLNVFGCSVDLYAADPAKPVVTIVGSTGKVTVLDIHVRGGSEGYHIENNDDLVVVKNSRAIGNTNYGYYILDNKVEITGSPEISGNGVGIEIVGNNVVLRTNKVLSNTGVGIDVWGDNNVVRGSLAQENGGHGIAVFGGFGEIKDNDVYLNGGDGINVFGTSNLIASNDVGEKGKGNGGDGIHVVSNSNTLDGNSVFGNLGDGIEVVGNENLIKRNDIGEKDKGNGGDGLRVDGLGNNLQENDAFANGGDGIHVSGGTSAKPNVLKKNRAGDRGKGNGGNGIWVEGTGDGKNGKVEVEENTAKSNGLTGIKVTGTGHQLKKNESGGSSSADKNGLCAFEVVAGNFNATGNKRNNVTISGSSGSAFPTGCIN